MMIRTTYDGLPILVIDDELRAALASGRILLSVDTDDGTEFPVALVYVDGIGEPFYLAQDPREAWTVRDSRFYALLATADDVRRAGLPILGDA